MTSLENRFVATLDELDIPDAQLAESVLADVARRRTRRYSSSPLPRLGRAFAALIVLSVGIVMLVEPARSAVADWLGIGATRVEVVPSDPRLARSSNRRPARSGTGPTWT